MPTQQVEAELQRRNSSDLLVAWKLVDDLLNTDTSLSDPVIDFGTRAKLEEVKTKLDTVISELQGTLTTSVNNTVAVSGTVTVANPTTDPETGLAKDATLSSILTELQQKLEAGGEVALDAATLAALESITATIANFPSTYALPTAQVTTLTPQTDALTDTELRAQDVKVTLDGESVAVTGTQTDALTDAELRASDVAVTLDGEQVAVSNFPATQAVSNVDVPDLTGTWGYKAGTSGTPTLPANARVIGISAVAGLTGGTLTIDSGDTITIPNGAPLSWQPLAQLVQPTLVFTDTDSYVVEYLT